MSSLDSMMGSVALPSSCFCSFRFLNFLSRLALIFSRRARCSESCVASHSLPGARWPRMEASGPPIGPLAPTGVAMIDTI